MLINGAYEKNLIKWLARDNNTLQVFGLGLYANEEQGVYGGKAYAKLHELELDSHLIGAESDLGAGRIYRFKTRVSPGAEPVIAQLAKHLEKLGIERDETSPAGGGADVVVNHPQARLQLRGGVAKGEVLSGKVGGIRERGS